MVKVVINAEYGGFGVSDVAAERIGLATSREARKLERTDPRLVQAVEQLGAAANGTNAQLEVVDVPDDVSWVIEEYDGLEWIAEAHRTWRA